MKGMRMVLVDFSKQGKRHRRRCSLCSERVASGLEVTREMGPPPKRGMEGGNRKRFICDGCIEQIAETVRP